MTADLLTRAREAVTRDEECAVIWDAVKESGKGPSDYRMRQGSADSQRRPAWRRGGAGAGGVGNPVRAALLRRQ